MQVQEHDGHYRDPEELDPDKLDDLLYERTVRRVLVFPTYGQDGKPTSELRRAWRRANRTRR